MRDSSATDFSGADIHEKEQMPPFKTILGSHFNMGEVCCCRYILLRFYKLEPIPTPSALRIGNYAMSVKNIADCGCRNIITEILHDSGNALIAPSWIVVCQPENFSYDFFFDRFTAALLLILSGAVVFIGNQL